MTIDIAKLVDSLIAPSASMDLKLNHDLVKTAALLCNIGRAYMYDIQPDGKFLKNDYGVLDSDTSLTRDAVKKAIADTVSIEDENHKKLHVPKHVVFRIRNELSKNPKCSLLCNGGRNG